MSVTNFEKVHSCVGASRPGISTQGPQISLQSLLPTGVEVKTHESEQVLCRSAVHKSAEEGLVYH